MIPLPSGCCLDAGGPDAPTTVSSVWVLVIKMDYSLLHSRRVDVRDCGARPSLAKVAEWADPPRSTSSLTAHDWSLSVRHGRRPGWSGAETGAQARPAPVPRAVSGASRLEPVEKVVTQSACWGLSDPG